MNKYPGVLFAEKRVILDDGYTILKIEIHFW